MPFYNSNGLQKEDADRARKNAPTYPKVPVTWDGMKRGPELPEDRNWCQRTREWWDVWRNSPQSMVMLPTDWELMLETAVLHNMLWNPGKNAGAVSVTQLSGEIRRRVAAYGASFEDRVKLRMEIETPDMLSKEEAFLKDAERTTVNYSERLKKVAGNDG